jgi:hypothetical protein
MKQAQRRKYHYIYRITRLGEGGKYYLGLHSTDNLEDGYFGSGAILSKSIKKYGKEKHIKEILEFLPSRDLLKLREKELITKELIDDTSCMNLVPGGGGGSDVGRLGAESLKRKRQDPVFDSAYKEAMSKAQVKRFENPEAHASVSNGVKKQWAANHQELKIATQAGQQRWRAENPAIYSNNQSKRTKGKIWITNGISNRMILPEDISKFPNFRRGQCRF